MSSLAFLVLSYMEVYIFSWLVLRCLGILVSFNSYLVCAVKIVGSRKMTFIDLAFAFNSDIYLISFALYTVMLTSSVHLSRW